METEKYDKETLFADVGKLTAFLKAMNDIYILINPTSKKPYEKFPEKAEKKRLEQIYSYNFNEKGKPLETTKLKSNPKSDKSEIDKSNIAGPSGSTETGLTGTTDTETLGQQEPGLTETTDAETPGQQEPGNIPPPQLNTIDLSEDTLRRLAYIFSNITREEGEFTQENILGAAETIGSDIEGMGQNIAQQLDNVGDYLQPLRNKTKEEIINEYERIGSLYFSSLHEDTREDLMKRLDMLKSMNAQAKALAEYKRSNPPYIEKDFTRAGFDMFYKVGDTTPNNMPLYKKYKFIQKIPDITISFDPKTGLYKCNQGSDTYIARNYKTADKWATLGGFYNAELSELRKMKIKMENLNDKFYPIFKARKL